MPDARSLRPSYEIPPHDCIPVTDNLPSNTQCECYICDTELIVFGWDRDIQADKRPVISLYKVDGALLVLPSTRHDDNNKFKLNKINCPRLTDDSFIYPEYQRIRNWNSQQLGYIGFIKDDVCEEIVQWAKNSVQHIRTRRDDV